MDILYLETEASKLRIRLIDTLSPRHKLLQIYKFFNLLLTDNNKNLIESYVLEFSEEYLKLIESIDYNGVKPDFLQNVLEQSHKILEIYPITKNKPKLESAINIIQTKYDNFLSILDGKDVPSKSSSLSLPLLVKDSDNIQDDYGVIGSLSVQLKPNKIENKFHIIPSGLELDPSLKKQVSLSFENALRIAGRYTRIRHNFWEIYIDFEDKSGEYSGSSFGVLLTLKLVEEFLRFHDSPTKIFCNSTVALTGAVDKEGNIPSLSADIIRQKTKIVFYSGMNLFILPEDDFVEAKNELKNLQTIYPKRNLKLTGIQVIDDLLNLRNVVEIKKESRILRTGKFVKRQVVSIISLMLLIMALFFSGIWDFDTNPAKLDQKGHYLYVLNKNEKILWKKFMYYDAKLGMSAAVRISARLFDIDSDGNNEIIIANEADTGKASWGLNLSRITCYKNSGEIIWTYQFKDTISTRLKKFPTHYVPSLIGIINEEGENVLCCFAHQYQYYPGVIFKIDVRTGKRFGNVFWNPGRMVDAYLGDFNKDGKQEIVAAGVHNGFECNFIFSLNLDDLKGTGPSIPDYTFYNKKIANFNNYILIPLTDMAIFFDMRYGNILAGNIDYARTTNSFRIPIIQDLTSDNLGTMIFVFSGNLALEDIDCDDAMQVMRDSLVAEGKLHKPLTNTSEYFNSLKEQFRYWDGEEFISSE